MNVDVAVVAALSEEIRPLLDRLERRERRGRGLFAGRLEGVSAAVGFTGDGPLAAGRGLDRILEAVAPGRLLGIGFAGGLDPHLERGDLVVGEAVTSELGREEADASWAASVASATDAPRGLLASAPALLADPAAKAALRASLGALTVDLETATWARRAGAVPVPWLAVRIVFDAAGDTVPRCVVDATDSEGRVHRGRLVRSALIRPRRLGALLRMRRAAGRLAEKLADAVEVAVRSI